MLDQMSKHGLFLTHTEIGYLREQIAELKGTLEQVGDEDLLCLTLENFQIIEDLVGDH